MFERFTERARRALFFARYESSQLGVITIEAEHLLLGILKENRGLPARVFAAHDMSYDSVRSAIPQGREKITTSVEIPFSAAAKKALQAAALEADRFGHNYIGTEHLLLGLIAESDGRTAAILKQHGMDLDKVRFEVGALLDEARPDDAKADVQSVTREIRSAGTVR